MELEHAHIMLLDGEYAEAEPGFQTLLSDHPHPITPSQRSELYLLLGQAQWAQYNLDDAKASLQQALQILPHPPPMAEGLHLRTRVLLDLAELWIAEQDLPNARQAAQDAQNNLALHTLERERLSGRSAYLQGRIAMMAEDYPRAQSHFEQALVHLEPSNTSRDSLSASCKLWLAQSLQQSGHYDGVVAILKPMVDRQEYNHLAVPADRVRVFYSLAFALDTQGDVDAAFKHGRRALRALHKLPVGHLPHAEEYQIC